MYPNGENDEKINDPAEGIQLPINLEDRIVTALKKETLIKRSSLQMMTYLKVAASIVIITGTYALGWLSGSKQITINTNDHLAAQDNQYLNQYLLLTRDPDNFIASEEHNEEYGKWVQEKNKGQNILSGAELRKEGWALKGTHVQPYQSLYDDTHPQGYISGFFVISAASDTQALRIASTCPHLRYNGVLELRTMN